MTSIRVLAVAAVLALLGLSVLADVPDGIGAASYARQPLTARPAAMGGAFVSIAEGIPAAYYNPAGLGRHTPFEAGAMYSLPYGEAFDTSLQFLGINGNLGELQTDSQMLSKLGWSVGWLGLSIRDIWLWDDDGAPTIASANSSLYTASAGIPIPAIEGLYGGASIKVYRDTLLDGRSFGIGLDLGTLLDFVVADIPVSIGVNAKDIGSTRVKWYGTAGEPDNFVHWVNKFGASARFLSGIVLATADFEWAVGRPSEEQRALVGLEVTPVPQLAVRGGWRGSLDGSGGAFTAGVGIYLGETFRLDYAYRTRRILGAGHTLSVSLVF